MIILKTQTDCITATYDLQEDQRANVIRLFGTDTIPTAFSAGANRTMVINEIRRLNPSSVVIWDLELGV